MKKAFGFSAFILSITSLSIVANGCVRSESEGPDAFASSTANPVTEVPSLIGQIPKLADIPADAAEPNMGTLTRSGNTAAANVEANNMKAAARAYSADNQGVLRFTSDDLAPFYVTAEARAKYYFKSTTGLITRVDSISGGWTDIVFSLSEQKWKEGTPDNDHPNDQDIP